MEEHVNDARMTIRLPSASLAFAREYAAMVGTTVTDLVVGYFDRLRKSLAVDDSVPLSVRDVAGIVPEKVDAREAYREHIMERYT